MHFFFTFGQGFPPSQVWMNHQKFNRGFCRRFRRRFPCLCRCNLGSFVSQRITLRSLVHRILAACLPLFIHRHLFFLDSATLCMRPSPSCSMPVGRLFHLLQSHYASLLLLTLLAYLKGVVLQNFQLNLPLSLSTYTSLHFRNVLFLLLPLRLPQGTSSFSFL